MNANRQVCLALWGKMAILLVFVWLSVVQSGTPLDIDRDLLNRMLCVESGGDICAIGDNGRSLGPYQIMESYYKDAVEHDPSLKDGGYTYNNVAGPGGKEYSERVLEAYMDRYATVKRLGREPTNEDIARIHNGGPNGYKKESTLTYWEKVMENPGTCLDNKQSSTEGVCDPHCTSDDCMCYCCPDAGICNCLTSTDFTPCSHSGSSIKSSDTTPKFILRR